MRDTPNNESIIIEYGFADSTGDDVSLIKNNWEDLAEAVVRGVANYLGVPYIPVLGSNIYVVKKGDTLWNIAKTFGISVTDLKETNNLTSNSLSIGQTLVIPNAESESDYYIVVKGDTLYKIANQFGLSVDELKKLNNLNSDTLSIGQKLLLKPSAGKDITDTYTVKAGDSLYQIARKYNTTVDELKRLNNLTSNLLSIGQVLKIPSEPISDEENIIYTVVAGDNLYQIARRYNTSVNAIKEANNLISDSLSIGQKLIIPR